MASITPAGRLPARLIKRQLTAYSSVRYAQTSAEVQHQNPAYPLYPSVSSLLLAKGIPASEVSKIPATGPKGRLLKGDVLAYIGSIPADYASKMSSAIAARGHLDLSNIKLAPKPAPAPAPEKETLPQLSVPKETSVAVSISLSTVLSVQKRIKESLGTTIPLSTFLARATDLANDDLPRSKFAKPSADELFNQVLGLDGEAFTYSRGEFIPEINAVTAEEAAQAGKGRPVEKEDIIDILSGKAPRKFAAAAPVSAVAESGASALNLFSVTVPEGDEKRAKVFLERLKTVLQVEPGRLVL